MLNLNSYIFEKKAHVFVFVAERPPRWRNVVWNKRAETLADNFAFQTIFQHPEDYSAAITRTCILFFFNHGT